ncbi:kinase [Magnetospira sp. QH-2]|uniref:GHMP family kinase ATP-binding protein n=1 Tax=Magnetospira sp. (strain QH-2) TaxID=1288970 RepID=UPI0003E8115C|nr:kinase [Magnetospira sp. QH-2]CCQ73091.1 conserved protein of unknown function [Magnetospira sp. QH-2]
MSFVLTRTPLRISFFGGGTDYPAWYREHGGAVLSTTIDKYCFISCRWLLPFFEHKYRIVWSHIETVNAIGEILHPAVRESLNMLDFADKRGIEMHHQGDLPARTGMGSSSSFAVGLIKALHLLNGVDRDAPELSRQAIELEQNWLKDSVGSQDQVAAAHGGLNMIRFESDGRIVVDPVKISRERRDQLNDRLMLFYTGTSRLSSTVAREVITNLPQRSQNLRRMREMVDDARNLLEGSGDLDDFGRMLAETWKLKRGLAAPVSNDRIDNAYSLARGAGALGGKLLGAGAGGFILLYVPPERQREVSRAMEPFFPVPFRFETHGCTQIQTEL